MGIQRSSKGRHAAVVVTEQVGRRKNRVSKQGPTGRQQFGGVGSAPQLDRGAAHLSQRAVRALLAQGSRVKNDVGPKKPTIKKPKTK